MIEAAAKSRLSEPVLPRPRVLAAKRTFAIVASQFNASYVQGLVDHAAAVLQTPMAKVALYRVPGAFEIPSSARTLAETEKYHGIVTLGCLLRGNTLHYEVIANEVTRGLGQATQETGVPLGFGVLTCDTLEQAIDRAGLKAGNKGWEAALAAVEMAILKKKTGRKSRKNSAPAQ